MLLFPLSGMGKLKKSLGQHFLIDDNVSRKIVQALPVYAGMQLLEVGPGGGALTVHLLGLEGIHFRAVEIDCAQASLLEEKFPILRDHIIREDILKCPVPFNGSFSVIGNFPFNISSQILFRLLDWKSQVDTVVGMFQKEVAQRIASTGKSKAYGIMSVLIQAFFDVEYLFEVNEQCFMPPPKVRSAVLRLKRNSTSFSIQDERQFFTLVKTSFGQRRKTLRNPTGKLFDQLTLREDIFSRRAEELTVQEFSDLSKRMTS